jgi:hypothetical protein
MDLPRIPMFVWFRYGTTIDHCANPGFVTPGVDRRELVSQIIVNLLRKYMLGTVLEYAAVPAFSGAVVFPFIDSSVIDLEEMATVQNYIGRSKNLPRQLKKFTNKGGEIRIFEGALPSGIWESAVDAFGTLDIMLQTPFQDNYVNMVKANTSLNSPEMVHFVALLEGEYAGHQSFCRSGNTLHCQAGAFDRRRKSTYHAYENIIVSSVEYALKHGLARIDYGPTLNETKKRMMTDFIKVENRVYTRYRLMAAVMPMLIARSKIGPAVMERWVGLGDEEATPPFI